MIRRPRNWRGSVWLPFSNNTWVSHCAGVADFQRLFFQEFKEEGRVVTPATSKPHHMLDNLGAGVGELPDTALQKRMAEYVDALPSG